MLRLPRFIKRFIKRNTTRIAPGDAFQTRQKLSLLYAFFAWHGLGLMGYAFYKYHTEQKQKTGLSDGRYYAELLKHDNVQLVRMRNTQVVGRWDLEAEKQKHGHLLTTEELEREDLLTGDAAALEQLV